MGRSGRGDLGARGARPAARDRRGDGARRGRALPRGGPVHRPARRGRPRPRGDQRAPASRPTSTGPVARRSTASPTTAGGSTCGATASSPTSSSRAAWRRTTPSTTRSRRGSTPWPSAARSCCSTCTPTTTGATAPTSRRHRRRRTPRSTSAPAASTTTCSARSSSDFMGDLRDASLGCGPLDARENVVFEGRSLAWWVHDRYPRVGCVLALEFKKTFMDEWTGELRRTTGSAVAQEASPPHCPACTSELETAAVTDGGPAEPARSSAPPTWPWTTVCPCSSRSFRFLLDITPVDADDLRDDFLEGREPDPPSPTASSRPIPDVVRAELDDIDLATVEDPVLGQLLRAKHREMELQLDMLEARDTDDFLPLSVELYGGVSPSLRQAGRGAAGRASPAPSRPTSRSTPRSSWRWPRPRSRATATRTPTSTCTPRSVPTSTASWSRATSCSSARRPRCSRRAPPALLHHEVGTHLVTQANGSHQPIKVLGVGLAGYDETQEGLAVLAEIACGGLTAFRLRQLASRVVTVHRLDRRGDVRRGPRGAGRRRLPERQRVDHRHARLPVRRHDQGRDLPARPRRAARAPRRRRLARPALARQVLPARPAADRRPRRTAGLLRPPRVLPRYLHDPATHANLARAAGTEDLSTLLEGHA